MYAADLGIRVMFTGFRDLGSLFENYVFQLIGHRSPRFLIRDGIEIDFLTDDQVLIEVKYYDDLRPKQRALFDEMDAKDKLLIKSVEDLVVLAPETELFSQTTSDDSTLHVQEEDGAYGTALGDVVHLGRSPGRMTVHGQD